MKVGIIGGGINGLFISWRLSSLGHKVQVYEAGKVLQQTSPSSDVVNSFIAIIFLSKGYLC